MIGMFDHQRREKGTKLHSITRMTITTWLSIVALGHSATYMFPESQIHQSFSTTAELPATMPQTTDPRSNSRILPKSFQNRKKRNAGEPRSLCFRFCANRLMVCPYIKCGFSWFAHTGLYVTPVGGTEGSKNEKTTRFAQTGLYVTLVGGLEGGKNEKKHVLESVVFSQ